MSNLPVLAPRTPGHVQEEPDERSFPKEHTEEEWDSMKGIIKTLYISDGRKLIDTMALLQSRYGFAATEQMYKKRLKKWNFRKRSYRKSPSGSSASTPVLAADSQATGSQTAEPQSPDAGGDTVMAQSDEIESVPVLLPAPTPTSAPELQLSRMPQLPAPPPVRGLQDSVSDCSLDSRRESQDSEASSSSSTSPSMVLIQPSKTGPYSDLEQVLGSVFTWSQAKLESGHVQSDPMSRYLAHPNHPPIQDSRTMYRTFELVFDLWYHSRGDLAGMAARRGFYVLEFVLTDDHPDMIWHVLDTIYDMVDRGHLQLLGMFIEHANILAQRQLPAQHPLLQILQQLRRCDYTTDQGRQYVCHLLRKAWLRNVDLLADHIGSLSPQRLWLYEQLIWDGRTRLRKGSELAKRQDSMYSALGALAAKHENSPNDDDESDRLRVDALMLEFTQMDLGDRQRAEHLARSLLARTDSDTSTSSAHPLTTARFHAYARKMLARVHEDRQDWTTAEENMRLAIRKREAAHGTNNNLRVIRDMWVLAAHFQKAGKMREAEMITADAISRAQQYLTMEGW